VLARPTYLRYNALNTKKHKKIYERERYLFSDGAMLFISPKAGPKFPHQTAAAAKSPSRLTSTGRSHHNSFN